MAAEWEEGDPDVIKLPPRPGTYQEGLASPADKRRVYNFGRDLAGDPVIYSIDQEGVQRNVRHICYHSPTGLEFGYMGSGPSDCARSILADCVGLPLADNYYHGFKDEFIAAINQETGGTISSEDICAWINNQLEKRS